MPATNPCRDPLSDAAASVLFPGLGQYLQRRRRLALFFAIEALALLAVAAFIPYLRAPSWAALVSVTLWSALDAARAAGSTRGPAA
jgi:hypothetical protein